MNVNSMNSVFKNALLCHGIDALEMEWRTKCSRARFEALLQKARGADPTRVRTLGRTVTREEMPPGGGARLVRAEPPDGAPDRFLYKEKLATTDQDGVRVTLATEYWGANDGQRRTVFRIKDRESFVVHDTIRIDLTRVETNDPRFLDDDEFAYEAELELVGDRVYDMTVEGLLAYASELATEFFFFSDLRKSRGDDNQPHVSAED